MMQKMRRTCRRWLALGAAGVLIAAPAAAQQLLGGSSPTDPVGIVLERVLVKVNGDIVTQTELEERQIGLIRQRGLQPRNDDELRRALQDVTPEVISGAVDELLLIQRARELGYQFTDEQFEEILGDLMAENGFETEEEFQEALAQSEGMTLDDLRRVMERQILVNQVQQIEVLGPVTLTEIEAREHYEANIAQYTDPATLTMREILIRVPEGLGGAGGAVDDQVRADAAEARQRVLDGEDFALVAVAVSDAASKANGGLIGPIDVSLLSSTLSDVLAGLAVGEISEPIRTPLGYQVLKLEGRTRPEPRPFDEVRDGISENVFNDRRLAEYARYLDRLRTEADFDWKDDRLKQAFDDYETVRASRLSQGGE
jgi:peptidyl-prolyl cis-trans isomerase SurA